MAPNLQFPIYTEPFEACSSYYNTFIEPSPDFAMSSNIEVHQKPDEDDTAINQPSAPMFEQYSLVPTYLCSPQHGKGNKVLRSPTVGYVAPEFKGKRVQKDDG